MKLTQECGTRWYRPRDWIGRDLRPRPLVVNGKEIGVAFGPIMFFWNFEAV